MNELSLFTGAGGGILGTTLLGWRHIGYVEKEEYCQRVIAQRIKDGILDDAPIFSDIKTFISEGFAASYRGLVDVITAGFPCQPFSVAGKQKGENDERNMWPETIECLRVIRPQFALLENVPGLLAHRYIQRIFGDLAESGYNARWCVRGADDVGAPHRRKRLWIVAHTAITDDGRVNSKPIKRQVQQSGECSFPANVANSPQRQDDGRERGNVVAQEEGRESINAAVDVSGEDVSNTQSLAKWPGLCADEPKGIRIGRSGDDGGTGHMADASGIGWRTRREDDTEYDGAIINTNGEHIPNTEGVGVERLRSGGEQEPTTHERPELSMRSIINRWPVEPDVGRVAHGVASRVDRLKAIGNGQVPRVAATAWRILTEEL